MPPNAISIETFVRPDGTLETANLPALPPGKVRVTIELLAGLVPPRRDPIEVLDEILRFQRERGATGRTMEEMERDAREQAAEDEAYEAKWRAIWAQTTRPFPD